MTVLTIYHCSGWNWDILLSSGWSVTNYGNKMAVQTVLYSDTSANEDNSFRNHIR